MKKDGSSLEDLLSSEDLEDSSFSNYFGKTMEKIIELLHYFQVTLFTSPDEMNQKVEEESYDTEAEEIVMLFGLILSEGID